jgi:hypothetical protein
LIGKCIKVKIEQCSKWHVSGTVIDLNPAPETVSADYFEKLDEARKAQIVGDLDQQPLTQKLEKLEKHHMTHFIGMLLVIISTYLLLDAVFEN